ncbi:MAG: CsgG/HfaB family protein [Desulfobacterales bacterium]|nr:CsgG/HfaB family protein [Desulfobacterales bacterium]MDJ0876238.1 CsgG/HfaB family protein [Desulfobacterales bacterium]MDJ0885102.1 CsgG/HfaB family protein [Desulfobacterales bacterium]
MPKRIILSILSMLLISCGTFDFKHDNATIAGDMPEIRRIAVLDFEFNRLEKGRIDRGKIERALNAGEIVADIFTEHLLDTGLYQIIGKKRTATIMQQHNLSWNDLLARSDWGPIRELLGVDAVVLGVVAEFGDWRSKLNWGGVSIFTARLVDLNSGQVVWSVSANRNLSHVNAAGAAHAGAESAVRKLKSRLRRSQS